MKVVVIPIPNSVSETEFKIAMAAFFNELGFTTVTHVFNDTDAVPNTANSKTSFMKAIDKVISTCGNPDDVLAFKTQFRAAVINDGDPNFELLNILVARRSKAEQAYLAQNHLEWLPRFADGLLNACKMMYGKDI